MTLTITPQLEYFCNNSQTLLEDWVRRERRKWLEERLRHMKCPMRTRRAPEMAGGSFMRLLTHLLGTCHNTLLFELASNGASEEEKGIIMRDFEAVRRHLWFTFKMKLSFWFTLPWVLMGLGHASVEVAVECGRRALALFNLLPDDHPHHWVTMLLCMHGSLGRQQFELFVSRARGLCVLPLLHRMAARFKFVMISERYVESLHAR